MLRIEASEAIRESMGVWFKKCGLNTVVTMYSAYNAQYPIFEQNGAIKHKRNHYGQEQK